MKLGNYFKHLMEFLILFAINGVMLWFFRGYFNLVIAVAMLLLFLYALISVHIVRHYVSISLQFPGIAMPKNTEFIVKVKVKNRCPLPVLNGRLFLKVGNVFMGEPKDMILTVPVKPLGEEVVSLPIRADYVGTVEVNGWLFAMDDILGMHAVWWKIALQEQIYIMPEGKSEETFDINAYQAGMAEAEESKLKGNDFSDISEVREYVPGDAMKNIHWKLSAKKDLLMVKERLRMSTGKLRIVLEMKPGKPEEMDAVMERLFGLGRQLIQNQIPVTLFWWNGKWNEISEVSAEADYQWQESIIQVFSHGIGEGYVEQQFRQLHPGSGYLLVNEEGIFTIES